MRRCGRLGLVVALAAVTACWTEPGAVVRVGDTIQGSGTVHRVETGGGFYLIRGDDGRTYVPLALAEGFQRDHLRVRFTARLRPDILALLIVGEYVELLAIEPSWPNIPRP